MRHLTAKAFILGLVVMMLGWDDLGRLDLGAARMLDQEARASQVQTLPETFLATWPEASRAAGLMLLEKYGPADQVSYNKLTWLRRGEWSRVSVARQGPRGPTSKVIETAVAYHVAVDRWDELARFDTGVHYDLDRDELVAVSESEDLGRLALNVADELIRGEKSVEQARNFYEKVVIEMLSGKSSRYTRRLLLPRI